MRQRLASMCLVPFLTLVWPSPAATQEDEDLTVLARRAKHSVVALEILDRFGRQVSSGTGFFIDPEGLIVTNRHVIEGGSRVRAVLSNEETLEVSGLMAADEENDLAIVKVDSGPYPALPLADSSRVEAGRKIVVLGGPLGLYGSLSEGIVAAVRTEEHLSETPMLQITAPISPGSSGSPVMNLEGEVVGVAVSQALLGNRAQNLNFAVPSAAVRELLGSVDAAAAPRPFGARQVVKTGAGAYLRNLVISMIFFAAIYLGYRYLK